MSLDMSRPLPTRTPITGLLDDANVVIRRAKQLESRGVSADSDGRRTAPSRRSGMSVLRRAGRATLYGRKCAELQPMATGLYYTASDAIMAALTRGELDDFHRQDLLRDWMLLNSSLRRG